MILLLSFCCFGFITQAQEFFIINVGYNGHGGIYKDDVNTNIWEKRLVGSPLLLRIGRINKLEKLPEFPKLREKWLKKIKRKILTKELKHCLKDTSIFDDKRFCIDVYFEKDGTVFTILFEIEQHLYEILPEKWVKETFNTLMKERINATEFWNFASSDKPDRLGIVSIFVKDFFFGKIRDQEELREKPIKPKSIYPPCGTFINMKKLDH